MTSTAPRRMDEIGEESRRRILDAAESLFAEQGYDRTSFVDIAARSGISRGSIPWHFKNKEGLLLAVVERANQRYLSLDHFGERPTLNDVLAQYVLMTREGANRLMFAVLTEAISQDGPVKEQFMSHHAAQRRRVAHWLKVMGVRSPAMRESLATAITGSVMGIALQYQVDPEGVDIEGACAGLAKMVHQQIGA